MKVALIDLDTSHPPNWIPILRELGHEVVGVYDHGDIHSLGYAAAFAHEHDIPAVFPSLEAAVDRVDLAIVHSCDWDPERRFAVLLENEEDVLKWFKPAKGDFQIHYSHEDSYEPDFVVETKTEKFLCEPKRSNEMTDETVQAKADAAATWCKHATDHANENGGKPWRYLLIAHDQIQDQMTLEGLAARCEVPVNRSVGHALGTAN